MSLPNRDPNNGVRYVRIQDTDKHGLHTLFRAEAYNHDAGLGVVI